MSNKAEDGFFLVWREGGGSPTQRHPSSAQARAEAKRLARANPGHRFVVLEAHIAFEVNDILVTNYSQEIPF